MGHTQEDTAGPMGPPWRERQAWGLGGFKGGRLQEKGEVAPCDQQGHDTWESLRISGPTPGLLPPHLRFHKLPADLCAHSRVRSAGWPHYAFRVTCQAHLALRLALQCSVWTVWGRLINLF